MSTVYHIQQTDSLLLFSAIPQTYCHSVLSFTTSTVTEYNLPVSTITTTISHILLLRLSVSTIITGCYKLTVAQLHTTLLPVSIVNTNYQSGLLPLQSI